MMNSKMEKSSQKPMQSEEVIKSRQETPKLLKTVIQVSSVISCTGELSHQLFR